MLDTYPAKVYLAGRITGDPEYELKFMTHAADLKTRGASVVLNPATLPEGLTPADYMRICFAMIEAADAVAFLPDWLESSGAQLEHQYCLYIGKPVWFPWGVK